MVVRFSWVEKAHCSKEQRYWTLSKALYVRTTVLLHLLPDEEALKITSPLERLILHAELSSVAIIQLHHASVYSRNLYLSNSFAEPTL